MSDLQAQADTLASLLGLRERLAALFAQHDTSERELLECIGILDMLIQQHQSPIRVPPLFAWPTDFKAITQSFGANPQLPAYRNLKPPGHEGIDSHTGINGRVYAIAAGVVKYIGMKHPEHPYGWQIRIEHLLHDGTQLESVYAHLKTNSQQVKIGDRVTPGLWIAISDRTGRTTADHLHLTVYENGVRIDPMKYLREPYEVK